MALGLQTALSASEQHTLDLEQRIAIAKEPDNPAENLFKPKPVYHPYIRRCCKPCVANPRFPKSGAAPRGPGAGQGDVPKFGGGRGKAASGAAAPPKARGHQAPHTGDGQGGLS